MVPTTSRCGRDNDRTVAAHGERLNGEVAVLTVRRRRSRTLGQSLAEFALVFPVFIALIGGIIQFGMVFWAQNTLTQVARDTGRWEATQQPSGTDCTSGASALGTQADLIARNASLFGYSAGEFTSTSVQTSAAAVTSYSSADSLAVAWTHDTNPIESPSQHCPPTSNAAVWHVTIRLNHTVPTFFPGMQYLPGLGTCDSSGCHIQLSSTVQYRMEPAP